MQIRTCLNEVMHGRKYAEIMHAREYAEIVHAREYAEIMDAREYAEIMHAREYAVYQQVPKGYSTIRTTGESATCRNG